MSREDLLKTNLNIMKDIATKVKEITPDAIVIVVTNPLDAMVYTFYKISGFPRQRVMGMAGVLDSTRFCSFVAMELGVSPKDVQAMVLGTHGDRMVPLPRYTNVAGIPITELLPKEKIEAIVERTRKAGTEIVNLLKTGSAYYAPGIATARMVEAIVKDEKRIMPASVYLEGEYGIEGVFAGVPILLGRKGIEKVIELKLSDEELNLLKTSAEHVRKLQEEVDKLLG
jgi:malate dehydrogenase